MISIEFCINVMCSKLVPDHLPVVTSARSKPDKGVTISQYKADVRPVVALTLRQYLNFTHLSLICQHFITRQLFITRYTQWPFMGQMGQQLSHIKNKWEEQDSISLGSVLMCLLPN